MQGHDHLRILTITPGSEYYFIYGNGTGMRGKPVLVDTTTNTINIPFGNPEREHYQNTDYATSGFWGTNFRDWWDNIGPSGQCHFVQVGTKTIILALYTNSFLHYWSTDRATLGLYYKENLIATIECKYGFMVEPKPVNYPIDELSVCLRFQNNSSVPIHFVTKQVWFEME
jgi:hypothetical protein